MTTWMVVGGHILGGRHFATRDATKQPYSTIVTQLPPASVMQDLEMTECEKSAPRANKPPGLYYGISSSN